MERKTKRFAIFTGILAVFFLGLLLRSNMLLIGNYAHAASLNGLPGLDQTSFDNVTIPNGQSMTVSMSPQNPKPNEIVTLSIESYSTDINKALITWTVNGKKIQSGIGQKSFTLTAGTSGSKTAVDVTAITSDGVVLEQNVLIAPIDIDLVWEAESYTPPYYEGKALLPYQGTVRVSAIPNFTQNGVLIKPENLVYQWQINGNANASASGYGKDSITYQGGIVTDPIDFSVTASTIDGSLSGTADISVNQQSPEILFYENNPLYGTLYNSAITGQYVMNKDEVGLKAAPYFVSTISPHDPQTTYKWMINSSEILPQSGSADTIVLRRPQSTTGTSILSVEVSDPSLILQFDNVNLGISYKSQ